MQDANNSFDYEAALAACARQESFALNAIYARDSRWLLSVALRIVKRRELAEEVLHDAFMQIWTKAHQYNPRMGSARGWVFTIVRNRALNALRNGAHEVSSDEVLTPEAVVQASGLLRVEVGQLNICMNQLDSQKQQAILLAFIEGHSHEQVAQRMNAPLGSVKSWIRRGLISLKECLS